MEDVDEENDKIRRSWQRARRDFQPSTCTSSFHLSPLLATVHVL